MDKDLNFVKDSTHGNYLDVVIDVNQDIFDVDWTPSVLPKNRTKRVVKPWMQDCQLIAARIHYSQKRNQLILLCNEYAWPVLLQREGAPTRTAPIDDGKHDESKIFFKNKYGRGLHLTGIRMPNELMYKGKNMHYFTAGPGDFGPGVSFLFWIYTVAISQHSLITFVCLVRCSFLKYGPLAPIPFYQ